jgi:hypothetical protein
MDTSPVRSNLLAVVKLFCKMITFEQELAAFARASNLVKQVRVAAVSSGGGQDADDDDDDDDDEHVLIMSDVDYLRLLVPRAIAAEFVSLPNSGRGGVFIMTPASGVPLDDLILRVSRTVPGSAYRDALMARLRKAVQFGATGLGDFHARLISPNPGASMYKKQWMACSDIVGKIFGHLDRREEEETARDAARDG